MEDRAPDNFSNRSEMSLESLKHPQQESGDQKMSKADEESIMLSLLENPKAMAHLRQKLNEPEKAENLSKMKKRLQAFFGFFQCVVSGSPSWAKAIFLYIWTRLLAIVTMQLEICKENRAEIDELQNNLKAVSETHEKVQGKVGEIEDKIKETRANDYKISSTEGKDLEIQLIIAERDLGNCEDGLSDVQGDVERLKAVIGWRKFAQTIGIIFAVGLAAAVLYYCVNVSSVPKEEIPWERRYYSDRERVNAYAQAKLWEQDWERRHYSETSDREGAPAQVKGLTTSGFVMIAGCLAALIGVPLKWMIESLYTNSKLLTECGKVLKDDLRKAKSLQKKLQRAVEKQLPAMKKHLVVLECDVSRYASLQRLDAD